VTILAGVKGAGKTSILAEIGAGLDETRTRDISFIDDAWRDAAETRTALEEFGQKSRKNKNAMLFMAGLPQAIDELLKDGSFSFLRKAHRVALGNVRVDEVFALYHEAFAGDDGVPGAAGGAHISEEALSRAAEATGGYPYMIQLVGYYLSKESKEAGSKSADKAIFLAKIELYKNIHEPLFWSLSSKDRMFLWAMAQDEGASEFGEIARRMDVSAGYASKYRERLINAGAIYRARYGELAFTLPFMKEYIEKEYIERLGGEGGKRRL
jgi:hypothetical protein